MTLRADGWYEWRSVSDTWRGNWAFDRQTRVFAVVETNGQQSYEWTGALDGELKGTAHERSGLSVAIQLKQEKQP
jgi:hypothetical protein